MDTKNEIIAIGIAEVLRRRRMSIDDISAHKLPQLFWSDVFDVVTGQGHKIHRTGDLSVRWARKNRQGLYYHRAEIIRILREIMVDNFEVKPAELEPSRDEIITKTDIINIVNKILDERNFNSANNADNILCPEPVNVRGQNIIYRREYVPMNSTIDVVLWGEFQALRRKLRVSTPRLLDSILWAFFGKPRLSFEIEVLKTD